jgi:hypothetical protein
MWDGGAGQATDDIIWCMGLCWVTKATDTHSEYVTLIAFPGQQWLQEHTSMLHYTYIASLVIVVVSWRMPYPRSSMSLF